MNSVAGREGLARADVAIGLLGITAAVFWLISQDTEASLFGLSFLGLVTGRLLGIPQRALFVLALTAAVLISTALLDLVGRSPAVSVVSHLIISGLLAWGLAEPVWSRLGGSGQRGDRQAVLTLVGVVLVVGLFWEIGEYIADSALGTSLSIGVVDSLADFAADGIGALVGAVATIRMGVKPR